MTKSVVGVVDKVTRISESVVYGGDHVSKGVNRWDLDCFGGVLDGGEPTGKVSGNVRTTSGGKPKPPRLKRVEHALLGVGGAVLEVQELDDGVASDGVDVASVFLGNADSSCEVGEVGGSLSTQKREGDLSGQASLN